MALSAQEAVLLDKHYETYQGNQARDELMSRYRDGEQRIAQLGMAVPPDFRRFLLVANWPGMYVDSIVSRQDVRALYLPGQYEADPTLSAVFDANNLDSELSLFLDDRYTYGRAFLSVGANEDDATVPLVHVESPREMTATVDIRRRRMTSAVRFYGTTDGSIVSGNPAIHGPTDATLYLPDVTVWVQRRADGQWAELDRDQHRLGRVPVVMSLCRRRSGVMEGRPIITRVNDIADAAARALTNLQFASEAHGVPQRWALGVSKGDFVDKDGKPLPVWEAYFGSIWANQSKDAKVGQFTASDLTNFETQLKIYAAIAGSVTYLPLRYFGLTTPTNPPSADSIRAEEASFVKFVEMENAQVGAVLGWAASLAYWFASGDKVDGSRIAVDWVNPATPTIAQREDALAKRYAAGVISREGYWDELGWSEARKTKERQYLAAEAAEGLTNLKLDAGVGA